MLTSDQETTLTMDKKMYLSNRYGNGHLKPDRKFDLGVENYLEFLSAKRQVEIINSFCKTTDI